MSRTIRIALVAEGVTDYVVLSALVENMLDGLSFDMKLLQPEGSVAFTGSGNAGPLGGGWKGVYRWCLQAAQRGGGSLSGDPLFIGYDLLLLHLDADVAGEDPANSKIDPILELAGALPCEQPCPQPNATTNLLRQIMLSWLGETVVPPQTVFCTPSKSTEAWVMAIFFPKDTEMTKKGWECHPKPADRLNQQPKSVRFTKKQVDYEARKLELQEGWPTIIKRLTEARRFHDDFTAVVQNLPA
jgi:hypothetical protein